MNESFENTPVPECWQDGYRIMLRDLPAQCPEPETQVVVYKLEFADEPVFKWLPTTPAVVATW